MLAILASNEANVSAGRVLIMVHMQYYDNKKLNTKDYRAMIF